MCGDVIIIISLLLTIVFRVCVLHTCAFACAMPWPDLPCVEVRASIRMPSSDIFLREGLSLNLELAISARLTGQGASRICLSTFPLNQCWAYRHTLSHPVFLHWFWGFKLRFSCFRNEHFTHWAASPTPLYYKGFSITFLSHPTHVSTYRRLQAIVCEQK